METTIHETDVDGEPAKVVLDADAQPETPAPPKNGEVAHAPLIVVSLDELARTLSCARDYWVETQDDLKAAKAREAAAKEAFMGISMTIARRGEASDPQQELNLNGAVAKVASADAVHFLVASETDPEVCVCGFPIADGPGEKHDEMHAEYLAKNGESIGERIGASAGEAE